MKQHFPPLSSETAPVLVVVSLKLPRPEEAESNLNMVVQKTTPTVSLNVLRTGAGDQKGASHLYFGYNETWLFTIINMED